MKNSITDKIEGAAHELKGAVKETVGIATNSPELEAEGAAERVDGKIQQKIGEIKKVFDK